MDNGKGVRKYSKLRQELRKWKYQFHLEILFICALFPVPLCVLVFVHLLLSKHTNPILFVPVVATVITLSAVVSGTFAIWFLRTTHKAPKGHFLNPLPPAENPILPDEELLVRASSSSAAQPAELLRATTETDTEKPEELLRAETGRKG